MQHLLQPRVLNQASVAGLATALLCYPRLSLWLHRPGPLWYLEAVIFCCAIILWSFVFAWHQPGTGRPPFSFKLETGPFLIATMTGLGLGAPCHFWLDPALRGKFPEEYPADFNHWLATVLFTLALGQLFVIFACFDWLIRVFKQPWIALLLTGAAAAGVQAMKLHSLAAPAATSAPGAPGAPLAAGLVAGLLAVRLMGGALAAALYLRGGVLPVWWLSLLFQSRELLDF
jgi:hypothetical protein